MSRFTKREIEAIKQLPTLGYWSMLDGVEIKQIEYGIEDYITVVIGAWGNKSLSRVSRLRVQHYHHKRQEGRSSEYIDYEGTKLWLDDCIRC